MLQESSQRAYSRAEVRRLLSLTERQLRSWEKQKLIPPADSYGFSDLIALRTLLRLRQDGVPAGRVRRTILALRTKLGDDSNPLTELKIFADGKKIHVQMAGRKMEPVSGQLLLDFNQEELNRLLAFPEKTNAGEPEKKSGPQRRAEAEIWFHRGLELEQTGAPIEQVIEAYENVVRLDPQAAGALVNLGTIQFLGRKFEQAEAFYRRALEADPDYPLAHFNLGNLFDEKGDRAQALHHYRAAVRLNPGYADAHYNLALLCQSSGQVMEALRHWKTYLKLDPASRWASLARREMEKLQQATVLPGSKRGE